MDTLFKALANPTRRHILELLRDGDCSAGVIADTFDINKPAMSHHLNLLKQAQLVQAERKGQSIVYSINTAVLQKVVLWIDELSKPGPKH